MISMMTVGNSSETEGGFYHQREPEMAVEGGMLELEEEEEAISSLCSPLLLRGGGGGGGDDNDGEQETSSLLTPQTIIEQTLEPDGSITIKASTLTPHPNGYRDVKIEHFAVPADKADSVDTIPGSPPPGAEYLTRVEYRVLSPGLELEPPDDDDMSTVYTTTLDNASVASSAYRRQKRKRKSNHRTTLLITSSFIFFLVLIGVACIRDYTNEPTPDDADDAPDVPPPDDVPTTPDDSLPDESGNDHVHHHHHHKNDTIPIPDIKPDPDETNSTRWYH